MKKALMFLGILLIFSANALAFSENIPVNKPTGSLAASGTLTAVGDLNFGGGLGPKILENPLYPWTDVKTVLNQATILVGNLEAPLSNRGSVYTQKTWLLRADPRTVQALTSAGFQVVTLANNHMMDYGPLALADTLATLDQAGIAHAGAGMNLENARNAAFYTTPDGLKFAFLAYTLTFPQEFWAGASRPGTAFGNPAVFLADIKAAKAAADFVVVSFHWSEELLSFPKDYQEKYARQCIDAGALVVLGHHPHVLQGFEVYHGGLIAYSLGNFAFGSLSKKCIDSVILAIDYDQDGLIRAKLYPVNINNLEVAYQTKLRKGRDAERVLQDLRKYSAEYHTPIDFAGETGIIKIRP